MLASSSHEEEACSIRQNYNGWTKSVNTVPHLVATMAREYIYILKYKLSPIHKIPTQGYVQQVRYNLTTKGVRLSGQIYARYSPNDGP